MNIKKYTKLSVLAFAISAVGSVHAGIGNVCLNVKNVSPHTMSLNAYDTGDAAQWISLTGSPFQIPSGAEAHGCFKTAYKADGVDIVVKSIHMADIKTSGGLTIGDIAAEGSYDGKVVQVNDGYKAYVGVLKDEDTLVIK